MITIVAKMTVNKESIEQFKSLAAPLIAASQAEEGNINYDLYQDINDETILTFIENWKDADAIKIHNQTPHFTLTLPKLSKLLTKPAEVNLYNIL